MGRAVARWGARAWGTRAPWRPARALSGPVRSGGRTAAGRRVEATIAPWPLGARARHARPSIGKVQGGGCGETGTRVMIGFAGFLGQGSLRDGSLLHIAEHPRTAGHQASAGLKARGPEIPRPSVATRDRRRVRGRCDQHGQGERDGADELKHESLRTPSVYRRIGRAVNGRAAFEWKIGRIALRTGASSIVVFPDGAGRRRVERSVAAALRLRPPLGLAGAARRCRCRSASPGSGRASGGPTCGSSA